MGRPALPAIVSKVMRACVRELIVRERIAMIEKGIVARPEVDRTGFETEMAHDRGMGSRA